MTDGNKKLRDRIAAALQNMTGPNANGHPITWEGMADAVIAELGLRREWGVKERTEPEPGWLSDAPDLPVREGELLMVRWLTDWKADDE